MSLISIGQFSQMTRLSPKALRLYHQSGLLVPAQVDPSSGYRFYAPDQANRAEAIRALRSVEMPLDEIQAVLDADDPELAHKQLVMHHERLADRLAADQRMLAYLETIIQRKAHTMTYDIQREEVDSIVVASTRARTSLRKISDDIALGFGRVIPAIGAAGLPPAGMPLIVYHDVIDEETDGDIEVCVPIAGPFTDTEHVTSRDLEGGSVATTTHTGPYQEIGPAYHALTAWIAEQGHQISGLPREIYLNDPQTTLPDELLTRVEFPV